MVCLSQQRAPRAVRFRVLRPVDPSGRHRAGAILILRVIAPLFVAAQPFHLNETVASTPGASNHTFEYERVLDPPTLSHGAGFYDAPFELTAWHADTGATLRYTLDGSIPDEDAPVFPPALAISSRAGESNHFSIINTTLLSADSGFDYWLSPAQIVDKGTVIRLRAFSDDAIPSRTVTATYFADMDLYNRYTLPVVSLVADGDDLFGMDTGIYVGGHATHWEDANYWQRGLAWERNAHVEIFEDRQLSHAQDAGVRIHGGHSRRYRFKSLRVYARSVYGENTFAYPLFPDQPDEAYKRFILRNAGNDWRGSFFRDPFVHRLVEHLRFDTQAYQPVIVFINGEYWGVHNLRERYDVRYLERTYGVNPDDLDILTATSEDQGLTVKAGDADHYSGMLSYIETHGVEEEEHYNHVRTLMDTDNYVDYLVAKIYVNNADWPENNADYWRVRTAEYIESAPPGHDGRWRWLFFDADYAFWLQDHAIYEPSHNLLAAATEDRGMSWHKPLWATFLPRKMLKNIEFRNQFINRMADQINTAFRPQRAIELINEMEMRYAPEMPAHIARHNQPASWAAWTNSIQRMRAFAEQRPAYQFQHLLDYFELPGLADITLAVSDPEHGRVQINSIPIDGNTLGLADPATPYPWSGTYVRDVPVTITAIVQPGYRFTGWVPDTLGTDAAILVTPDADLSVTAMFEPVPLEEQPVLLHEWDFEDARLYRAPSFTVGGGALHAEPGPDTEMERNDPAQGFETHHLRVNDPLGAELIFRLPTKGYDGIRLSYWTRRSGQGAGEQTLWYTTNGVDWAERQTDPVYDLAPQERQVDFSGTAGAGDNMDFGVRITFAQGDGGESGNNRFDDVRVTGVRVDPSNAPPVVEEPPGLQQPIEGGAPVMIDLDGIFIDPDADPLIFSAISSHTNKAQVFVDGSELVLIPMERGQAEITVTADDGNYHPAVTSFRVLVHPAAHALAGGAFRFSEWDPDLPDGTYPEHMLFLQSDQNDTALGTPLLYAYTLRPEDYHANDQDTIGYPYNNTGRTRINGLNAGGMAFINTGQDRDLGGALLAVDTTGLTAGWIRWLGGTVLPNSRIYGLRLQYRVGLDGPFMDLLDEQGRPIEYVSTGMAGHAEVMPMAALPASALDAEYVQLLWRYYRISGDSGPRAQLRLNEILVSPFGVQADARPGQGGTVTGERLFATEQPASLTAEPALYYHFLHWAGDVPPGEEAVNPLELWVDGPRLVTAWFGADVTENTGTPHWWLAKYGLTNDTFEAEALKDHSGNDLPAWMEHIADLDPTDPEAELPRITLIPQEAEVRIALDATSTARVYAIQHAIDLIEPNWLPWIHAPGTGSDWSVTWTNNAIMGPMYFRGRISLPD